MYPLILFLLSVGYTFISVYLSWNIKKVTLVHVVFEFLRLVNDVTKVDRNSFDPVLKWTKFKYGKIFKQIGRTI